MFSLQRISQKDISNSAWPYDTNNDPYQDPPDEESLIASQLEEKTRTLKRSNIT